MSQKTPFTLDGFLQHTNEAIRIALDSSAWFAWLTEEQHCTFRFIHPTGGFTARKESKQRGQSYWVAYRQFHNKLHKLYLGKSETLTTKHLEEASKSLAESFEDNPTNDENST